MNKLFDLRFVIGAFFTLVGILLLLYGFLSQNQSVQAVNKWCGSVFTVFGILMIFLSFGKDAHDELLEKEV